MYMTVFLILVQNKMKKKKKKKRLNAQPFFWEILSYQLFHTKWLISSMRLWLIVVNEFTIALRIHNACPSKDGKMLGCNGLF